MNTRQSTCPDAWSCTAAAVLARLGSDPASGLATGEAEARLVRHGPNQLKARQQRRTPAILLDQLRSIVVVLLLAAGGLALLFGHRVEALAVFVVIAINTLIGFLTEWRAVRSMEALGRLGVVATRVIRDGEARLVPAEELVPGDIVVLDGGDVVTADLRLVEAAKLQADESTLTGESLPVAKSVEALPADTSLPDRRNMVFKGTALTRGTGIGVVCGTGRDTEFGHIFELVLASAPQETPLEKRLNALGNQLAWAVLALAVLLAAGGVLAGRDVYLAVEVAIALAVAAIPEGLPVVATMALARGMWRMARHRALVSRLSAVETLGATSMVLTDKTGTLTENSMTVTAVQTPSGRYARTGATESFGGHAATPGRDIEDLLTVAALCGNAALTSDGGADAVAVGDPMEVALLRAAARYGIRRNRLLQQMPELREVAFDPKTKLMATVHRRASGAYVAVKGAPEAVLPLCVESAADGGNEALSAAERAAWLEAAAAFGAEGLRTLALAQKAVSDPDAEVYADLGLLGIVGFEDPPRAGIAEAIAQCRAAGIRVVMVTGDHAATARHIAREIGLLDASADGSVDGSVDDRQCVSGPDLDAALAALGPGATSRARVFSRVTPEQKLRLIEHFQMGGNVVAMTGDGVNDAPALKKADIGIAMGMRGTAVAKEAAAMVLLDDDFRTIVAAVNQGRAIFDNIRKFVVYLLSCNISEVLVVTLATLAGAPLPLLPLQILFLNLVTDVFPALALGVGPAARDSMTRPPRPANEPILTRVHWWRVGLSGLLISCTVLAAMATATAWLGMDARGAVTVSFCTLAFAQLWHVFNMREDPRRPLRNEIARNPWIWGAIALCTALILVAVHVPVLAAVLQLANPGGAGWLLVVVFSVVPLAAGASIRRLAERLGSRVAG